MSRPTKIERVSYHRNGVSGESFHVVKFHDPDPEIGSMLGVVFCKRGRVAVFNRDRLAAGDIDFYTNSWRGDHFETVLRRAVRDYQLAQMILPTDQWAAGWSPADAPVSMPKPKMTKAEAKSIAKVYEIAVAEAEHFMGLLRDAVSDAEKTGQTQYVYRNDAGQLISTSSRRDDDRRCFTIFAPERDEAEARDS